MTPVPVVSTPLNTRTEREMRDTRWREWVAWQGYEGRWPPLPAADPDHFRERLVADPAFVVLPEVPDLTCRNPDCCYGKHVNGCRPGIDIFDCPSCGGSGVSPVYAATWQCRMAPNGAWALDCGVDAAWTNLGEQHERRQLVEWRARRVEPLPVVAAGVPVLTETSHIELDEVEGPLWADGYGVFSTFRYEPWAADLQPGMCVLRLSDWEHLEQPYTEMPTSCDGYCTQAICPNFVPLSVPDGVLSWIELTR